MSDKMFNDIKQIIELFNESVKHKVPLLESQSEHVHWKQAAANHQVFVRLAKPGMIPIAMRDAEQSGF